MLPEEESREIAKIIYDADCEVRERLANNILDVGERGYFGALVMEASGPLMRFVNRGITFRLSARDMHTYDGIFIFRLGNTIKIGICESKLLRFINDYGNEVNLDNEWDALYAGQSRFFTQVSNFSNWDLDCARWIMWMNNLPEGEHRPPLEGVGSSCIWIDELNEYFKEKEFGRNYVWTYQDVLNIEQEAITNLEEIIYDILRCNKGNPIEVDSDAKRISIKYKVEDGIGSVTVPLPDFLPERNTISNAPEVASFLRQYKFSSLTYLKLNPIKKG